MLCCSSQASVGMHALSAGWAGTLLRLPQFLDPIEHSRLRRGSRDNTLWGVLMHLALGKFWGVILVSQGRLAEAELPPQRKLAEAEQGTGLT